MRYKKPLALIMAVMMLLCSLPALSASAVNGAIAPFWINTSTVQVNIVVSGTTAVNRVTIHAVSGSTITANVYLYEVDGNSEELVESWLDETSGSILSFREEYSVESGATYKLIVIAEVTRNGVSETITESAKKTVP